jgi:drug/metabolite transporter (DMT)-like permease
MVLEAPLATLLAVALLGEQLAPEQWAGIALVLAAAVLPSICIERAPAVRPAPAD